MAVTQSVTLTQQSQSVANNNSVVKLLWTSTQSGQSYNGYTRTAYYYVSINGGAETTYSVSYTLPKASTKTIVETTITVPHRADGTGSISVRTWMDTDIYEGVIQKSAALTLTTIPRCSTLTVSNGTLDVAQNLTVKKESSGFTHTITYKCGSATGTICTKDSKTTIAWTPPITLASQNTTGENVTVTFTITTYNGSTSVGSKTATASYYIPDSVFPPLAITVEDYNGYHGNHGCYIQGKSRLSIGISTYGVYGAWIKSYSTVFDGQVYTTENVVTSLITGHGTLTGSVTVTDSRGRTCSVPINIEVEQYNVPKIISLSAKRCDYNGKSGEHIEVKYSAEVTVGLASDSAYYIVKAKKTSEASYKPVSSVESGKTSYSNTIVFEADPTSSYDILLMVDDEIDISSKATAAPSASCTFSFLKKLGKVVGAALGKVAELEGVFEIAWQAKFSGGILHPVLQSDTDVDSLLTPGTYMLLSANSYINTPEEGIGAFFEIVGIKDTSLIQRYSVFSNTHPRVYERPYINGAWQPWVCVRGDFIVAQGVMDGWTYRKWNSGVAECWKRISFSTAMNTAWGSMYRGTITDRQNYPFAFTAAPVEVVTMQNAGYAAWICAESIDNGGVNGSYASARYIILRPSAVASAQTFYINYHITGKWK